MFINFEMKPNESLARDHAVMDRGQVEIAAEGAISIFIEYKIFFSEPEFPHIELAVFLQKWLEAIEAGAIEDFVYESMEHDEPLLEFYLQPDGTWIVCSIWQLFESEVRFSTAELVNACSDYISRLRPQLKTLYGIEFDDYTWDWA